MGTQKRNYKHGDQKHLHRSIMAITSGPIYLKHKKYFIFYQYIIYKYLINKYLINKSIKWNNYIICDIYIYKPLIIINDI